MNSLVIGASGMVGSHIVAKLIEAGERPYAVSRAPHETTGVDWLPADLGSPDGVQWPAVTTVYCTAYVGLLAAALPHIATPSLRRVIVFTSTSIVTKFNSEVAEERDLAIRWAADEQRLIETCTRMNIMWTILRPTLIYDEGRDANVTRLAGLIERLGFMPLAGAGAGKRQPVHAADLAAGAIIAAARSSTCNKIYDLPGTDTMTYREMIERICDGLGRPRRVVPLPLWLWRCAFMVLSPFLAHANVAMGNRMSKDLTFDATPAAQDFGWKPRAFRPVFKREKILRRLG